MKILMVQNRYLIRGGEDETFDSESSLLEYHGNEVIRYIQDNKSIADIPNWQLGIRTIWSQEDYHNLRHLIRNKKPDLVHVQNFFPLISPTVYYAAKAEKVPVVQSLHNYRLWCLNAYFFRNGNVCQDCLKKPIPLPGIIHKCYRGNYAASLTVASMLTIHRAIQTWNKMVDCYIALTEFTKNKFIEGGLPADKIVIKPNFVDDPGIGDGLGNFVLYVGRLSPEKGLNTLLEAWKSLGNSISLKIIGDGDLKEEIERASATIPGIEYLGRQTLEVVYQLMGQAKALIFPSQWYEGLPRTIIESFAKGTPVIASNLGSMTSLIEHQRTGLHFSPGNSQSLIEQVQWMLTHSSLWQQMRTKARKEFEAKYTAEVNYQKMMEIYQIAIANSQQTKKIPL